MDASVLPLMQALKNMSIKGLYCGRFYDHSLDILNSENAFGDKALESLNFLTPALRTLKFSLTRLLSVRGCGTIFSYTLLHEKSVWNQSF